MSGISTHILDLPIGRPAAGVAVRLEREENGVWVQLSESVTGADGRVQNALPADTRLIAGRYRLGFETGTYYRGQGISCFHPWIAVTFDVIDDKQNYHVPLLITPYSYSTYRGS
jgi:5-hydroxyisourate hydrolase